MQTEMIAQRVAAVFRAEQIAAAQFWQNLFAECIEVGRQERRQEVEAIAGAGCEPFFHVIHDLDRGPGESVMTAAMSYSVDQLADRQILASGHVEIDLMAALAAIDAFD